MLKQNSELRAEARAALTDKWVMAAIATLIYSAVVGGLSAIPVVGILILLLTLPRLWTYHRHKIASSRLYSVVDLVAGYSGYYQVLFVCNDRFYLERSTRIG